MFYELYAVKNGYEDAFNRTHIRSLNNTRRENFNCGGYALETFSWYCPNDEDDYDLWGDFFCSEKEIGEVTQVCVDCMLKDFPEMRLITTVSELSVNEYAIAFRVSSDGDFHYVKRDSTGHWRHKRGSRSCIETMTTYEVFNTEWCGRYDGPIILFAKSRD